MESPYAIRRASAADVPALAGIERACFSDPWSAAGLLETVQTETTDVFVALKSGTAVGYAMARSAGLEGEILNLAVLPADRKRGVGQALLEAVLQPMAKRGVREAYLEVRESNADAIGLYRRNGFRPVGIRAGYYRNPGEDALVLRAEITPLRD